jgi:hypothetical protein
MFRPHGCCTLGKASTTGHNARRARAAVALATVIVLLGAVASCQDPVDVAPPATLELHAFPAQVTPNGEATLVAIVHGDCAQTGSSCLTCIGLMPGAANLTGSLYSPDAPSKGVASSLALPALTGSEPMTLVYRAPPTEGSEVVSATLLKSGSSCTTFDDAGVDQTPLATTTVRITIAKTTPSDAGSAPAGDGGDAGDAGVTDAAADTGDSAGPPGDAAGGS